MTAVLALTAILSGAAALVLSGPRQRAAASDAAGQVAFADALVRQAARAGDQPFELVIDLARGRWSRGVPGSDEALVTLADLPAGERVDRVQVGQTVTDSGLVRLPVTAAGVGPSYAVRLSGPSQHRWLVMAGLTGQVSEARDETMDAILQLSTSTAGPDAR